MSSDNELFLGLDGGGTKVEAVLIDSTGAVVSRGAGGPVNTTFVAEDIARKSIQDAITSVMGERPAQSLTRVGGCFVGGISIAEDILRNAGYNGSISRFSEHGVAFRRAGLLECCGIAIVAGTGSSFRGCGRTGEYKSIGGWGIVVGDEGSGFDIGLQTIKAAGRSLDGRGPRTILVDLLLRDVGSENFNAVFVKYCRPCLKQYEIASLAGITSEAASQGDEVAIKILADAGESLGSDAVHLAGQIFGPDDEFDVVCSGGVFNSKELVMRSLRERLTREFPKAKLHAPMMSAGEAVALMTLERYRRESAG